MWRHLRWAIAFVLVAILGVAGVEAFRSHYVIGERNVPTLFGSQVIEIANATNENGTCFLHVGRHGSYSMPLRLGINCGFSFKDNV